MEDISKHRVTNTGPGDHISLELTLLYTGAPESFTMESTSPSSSDDSDQDFQYHSGDRAGQNHHLPSVGADHEHQLPSGQDHQFLSRANLEVIYNVIEVGKTYIF